MGGAVAEAAAAVMESSSGEVDGGNGGVSVLELVVDSVTPDIGGRGGGGRGASHEVRVFVHRSEFKMFGETVIDRPQTFGFPV